MEHSIRNKKVSFNYEILEKFEAGIELIGTEVKSIRAGHTSLDGSHILIRGGEAFLVGATIPPYQTKNAGAGYDPIRNRKLLLTQKELFDLEKIEKKKGLTIVPIALYSKGRKIKIEIAVVQGKKKFDKRETIKKRETERDIRRTLKNQ
jgi:SsrA-binding protein